MGPVTRASSVLIPQDVATLNRNMIWRRGAGQRLGRRRPGRLFCQQIGAAKANSLVDLKLLEYVLRDDLYKHVQLFVVLHRAVALVVLM